MGPCMCVYVCVCVPRTTVSFIVPFFACDYYYYLFVCLNGHRWRWHTEICPGGFLPPYDGPHYNHDGLDMRNVEWYSGGLQLCTVQHSCNMQRILLLEPENFSKSLLYHTANNKQRQLTNIREEAFTKANTLLGQLNTIKKRAEKEM